MLAIVPGAQAQQPDTQEQQLHRHSAGLSTALRSGSEASISTAPMPHVPSATSIAPMSHTPSVMSIALNTRVSKRSLARTRTNRAIV